MKVAIIGSRGLVVGDLGVYVPKGTTELVSGGARGIDACVRQYAEKKEIPLVEFLPQYDRFGRAAPILRNREIVEYADCVVALWNGASRGTKRVIDLCKQLNKPITIFVLPCDHC